MMRTITIRDKWECGAVLDGVTLARLHIQRSIATAKLIRGLESYSDAIKRLLAGMCAKDANKAAQIVQD